jgi:hypothetical protein
MFQNMLGTSDVVCNNRSFIYGMQKNKSVVWNEAAQLFK